MAYCRRIEGDIYLFQSAGSEGGYECNLCPLAEPEVWAFPNFSTANQVKAHLKLHEAAGHDFPKSVYDDIDADVMWDKFEHRQFWRRPQ